jgi:serine/threonine protein kinase
MNQYKPGDRIGGEYKVLRVFGGENRSGMGVVYLVSDREYPKPIVLKTLQDAESEDSKRRFVSEAAAWINAGVHSNLVQAYWVRDIAGQLFVAAEYIQPDEEERNNLTHFLSRGPVPIEVILLWSSQFCSGMNYALSKGIRAHRDIKPDNLMIDSTGTLKVTDFGLAKLIAPEGPLRRRAVGPGPAAALVFSGNTIAGSMLGTLPYMAPEQFLDAKTVDCRADIYSFGIVLFQMATGNRYPFCIKSDAADITYEYFRAHAEQPPSAVESPIAAVISRCLQKTPARRYATYSALLADLEHIARELQITIPRTIHVSKENEELYAQAQSYVALGNPDGALAAIDEYVQKYPENDCGWTEKGRIHFERSEYREGLAATTKSLEVNPYNSHAWNNLGILLNRTHATIAEVKRAYTNALRFDPYNTATMMNLVGPLIDHEEWLDAATITGRALRVGPEKPLILQKAEALLKVLFERRKLSEAEILLRNWTEARRADVDAWHNLGLLSLDSGNIGHSIECFEQVRRLAPDDNFAVVQLAKLFFQDKKGRQCLECCNELLERGHEPLLAVSLKARALNYMGWYDRALAFLKPYLDHNPANDALWVVLAEIHEYREEFVAAIDALSNAQRLLRGSSSENRTESLHFVNLKIEQVLARKAEQQQPGDAN